MVGRKEGGRELAGMLWDGGMPACKAPLKKTVL